MNENLAAQVLAALVSGRIVTTRGTIHHGFDVRAKNTAGRVIEPLVPAGTCGWLVLPKRHEKAKEYAVRAVRTAAAAAAWAGGLTDGTEVYPDHAAAVAVGRVLGA